MVFSDRKNWGGKSRLLIVDDGSTDSTRQILEKIQIRYPKLIVLAKENGGHGAACIYGYQYAIDHEADYIFQTDSDGQTDSNEFWNFWEQRENYDMVIGWRRRRKDGFSRVIVTKVLKIVIRVCFKENVIDANTPFRLMKTDILKKYIVMIPGGYNLSNVLLSVIYAKKNLKVKYIPISFQKRQGGKNFINLRKIIKIGKDAVMDFTYLNKMIEYKEK